MKTVIPRRQMMKQITEADLIARRNRAATMMNNPVAQQIRGIVPLAVHRHHLHQSVQAYPLGEVLVVVVILEAQVQVERLLYHRQEMTPIHQ